MESVVRIQNVSKIYEINPEKKSIKQLFIDKIKRKSIEKPTQIQIFKDVSFEIYKGEVFGIIGENGAGKSTALKIMAGIIAPDNGRVEITGSVAALLEIGLGFHPDLTGKENARLYGSILGIDRKLMKEIMPDIFKFAGLEGYEHVPIKRYSSGMQVRLAFSVATSINPDILLLDEVFSVGDQNFQTKSFEKIKSFIDQKKTVLLVTHDLGIVSELCTRVMFIRKRGNIEIGSPEEMIEKYDESLKEGATSV
jgi:ABC-2 type transport system ATP-binding protein